MSEERRFRADIVERDREAIVEVCGDVDLESAQMFYEAIERASRRGVGVVVDLSELDFIDSSGIDALVRAGRLFADGELVVRSPRPQARKVLELTGVDQRITING